MLYAQIKKSCDCMNIYKKVFDDHYMITHTVIKDELYTMTEVKKYSIPDKYYDIVDFPKTESYFVFGCRYNTKQNR